ncbi:hypothetical protein XELAEV_18004641mg [Xenopus laevis]|uniref:Uncharacterized protein n=1 Tax=Xenopus laevis TaxID=8355 RepID=A0A974BRB7_XENLA|nr:hypothetical protein XELAEV_18004641mg [Xenopus laevis]
MQPMPQSSVSLFVTDCCWGISLSCCYILGYIFLSGSAMLGAKMFLVLIYLTALRLTSISSQIQSKKPACHLEIIKTFEDYEYMKEGDIMIAGVLTVNTLIVSFEYPMGLYDAMLCVG